MIPSPASHADISGDGVVKAASGAIVAVILTPAAALSSLILYHNPSAATGTVLLKLHAVANGASVAFEPAIPYVFATGCYADIGGTGANATVVYL